MPGTIWLALAFITGLCFGSFANVIIYRIPRGLSIITPPSACPACGYKLRLPDLVPVLSWLALRGRCRSCKKNISARYPIIEAACALLFTAMVSFTTSLSALPLSFLAFLLLSITLIDQDVQEIPDSLVIAGTVTGILWIGAANFPGISQYLPLAPTWQNALLGALAGTLPLLAIDRICLLILKKDGFGYGDVKLMGMVGIHLGWQLTLATFFFAFITAGTYAAYLIITGRAERGAYIAFGPFLCAGTLFALWFGTTAINLIMPL